MDDVLSNFAFQDPIISNHAKRRMQQRAIPACFVEYLLDFADPVPTIGGAERYAFSHKSWRRLCRHLGAQAKDLTRLRRVYAIVAGSVLVTVAWMR